MNPVMYIIANKGLEMSPGKLAAQVAHAAVEAYKISDDDMIQEWEKGGHYCKIVLSVSSEFRLWAAKHYIESRYFDTELIIDEGRTEIDAFSPTALGVAVVDKDDPHTKSTFSTFRLY